MNYKAYYEKLIEKSQKLKEKYSLKEFSHRKTDYYLVVRTQNNFKYAFIVASNRSRTYGKNFKGLIVEIYTSCKSNKNSFEQLKEYQDIIEKKLNLNLHWQNEGESDAGTACRIFVSNEADNLENETLWDEHIEWQLNTMDKFLGVLPEYIDKIKGNFMKIKIGEFIQEHLKNIEQYCNEHPEELNNLMQRDYSKKIGLTATYPFLKLADDISSSNKDERYWKRNELKINNHTYHACSQFGGGEIREDGKTRSQYEGELFLKYLKEKNILLDKYKEKDIEFIVGNTNKDEDRLEDEKDLEEELTQLKIKNIILYGVPGVGKTYSHKMLIDLIESKTHSDNEIFSQLQNYKSTENFQKATEEKRVQFLTFHQSFGYEDFVEGFRPNENGEIKLQYGVFKNFCDEAEKNKEQNYYLVIDEINRGNISKIFGELITLIEEDKRDALHVTLPYSKKTFHIPSNLYIIGTMNSTDKSIALIDIALRRRFTFLKLQPNPEVIEYRNARKLMKNLNTKITNILGEDYQIGHSYFMSIRNEVDLDFVKKYKITPLLEEYFYGDKDGFDSILKILNSSD